MLFDGLKLSMLSLLSTPVHWAHRLPGGHPKRALWSPPSPFEPLHRPPATLEVGQGEANRLLFRINRFRIKAVGILIRSLLPPRARSRHYRGRRSHRQGFLGGFLGVVSLCVGSSVLIYFFRASNSTLRGPRSAATTVSDRVAASHNLTPASSHFSGISLLAEA